MARETAHNGHWVATHPLRGLTTTTTHLSTPLRRRLCLPLCLHLHPHLRMHHSPGRSMRGLLCRRRRRRRRSSHRRGIGRRQGLTTRTALLCGGGGCLLLGHAAVKQGLRLRLAFGPLRAGLRLHALQRQGLGLQRGLVRGRQLRRELALRRRHGLHLHAQLARLHLDAGREQRLLLRQELGLAQLRLHQRGHERVRGGTACGRCQCLLCRRSRCRCAIPTAFSTTFSTTTTTSCSLACP